MCNDLVCKQMGSSSEFYLGAVWRWLFTNRIKPHLFQKFTLLYILGQTHFEEHILSGLNSTRPSSPAQPICKHGFAKARPFYVYVYLKSLYARLRINANSSLR